MNKQMVVRKRRPRRRRKRRESQAITLAPRRTTRQVVNPMQSPTYFKVSGTRDEGLKVNAAEVISEVYTQDYNVPGAVPLSPGADAGIFPKLGAFASVFQRYRFNRIKFKFLSVSPTGLSGGLSLAVGQSYDLGASQPRSVPEVASFPQSFVCSIGANGETSWYKYNGGEWFETDNSLAATDPSKVYQLMLYSVITPCQTSEVDRLGGYVVVEYEIEFQGLRPQQLSYYGGRPCCATTLTSSGSYANITVPVFGQRDKNKTNALLGIPSDLEGEDLMRKIAAAGAEQLISWLFDVDAPTLEDDATRYHPVQKRGPRTRFKCLHRNKASAEACQFCQEERAPMAANDITVTIYGVSVPGGATVIGTVVENDAGAAEIDGTFVFDNELGTYDSFEIKIATAGAETRVLNYQESFWGVTQADPSALVLT